MIEIKMTGMCEKCQYANLELHRMEGWSGETVWIARCIHEYACKSMKDRAKEEVEHERSDNPA